MSGSIFWVGLRMSETMREYLSESVQMYLVTVLRLRPDGQPLPLSELAEALSISPVSANEMCRKLQDQGLVTYRPYKGVTLTELGEGRASHTLRRHRLWEVFLVEKLGFDFERAHASACALEHATPDPVAERLNVFLDHPSVNPRGEPIPRGDAGGTERMLVPLTALQVGQRAHVVRRDVTDAARAFLDAQGIAPGEVLTVVGVAQDGLLVSSGGGDVSLARSLAQVVEVEMAPATDRDMEAVSTSPGAGPRGDEE